MICARLAAPARSPSKFAGPEPIAGRWQWFAVLPLGCASQGDDCLAFQFDLPVCSNNFGVASRVSAWQHESMATKKPRRAFEEGHRRKFLVIVDETAEVDAALYFAASRAKRTGGSLVLLYVIQPQEFQHWMGVKDIQVEEETNKAKALFRLFRRKLGGAELEDVICEEVIREGTLAEEIAEAIEDDEDIGILVLGASTDSKGPGPLVSNLAAGKAAGSFPVPITIVPGNLSLNDVTALA